MVRQLSGALAHRVPQRMERGARIRRAAVALILRTSEHAALELLMIKRAEYASDPWSGHIALPGGREEPYDRSLEETVVRETREETALDLVHDGLLFGRLDDLGPHSAPLPPITITPFLVAYGARGVVTLSPEVAEAFWVPVDALRDPRASREIVLELTGGPRRVQSFEHEGRIIWGLTERILRQFLSLSE
ncbi:MAG TPA: CoA pyrophosphatase [Gemmatimonadaceae bacterium]|nr:CoA pyrophosphatase [Gemmatimonadaceae bacterium]